MAAMGDKIQILDFTDEQAKKADGGFELVGINDLMTTKQIAHAMKYDSTQGKYNGTIENCWFAWEKVTVLFLILPLVELQAERFIKIKITKQENRNFTTFIL